MSLTLVPLSPLEAKRRELAAAKKANQYANFRYSSPNIYGTKLQDDIWRECQETARLVDKLEDEVLDLEEAEQSQCRR